MTQARDIKAFVRSEYGKAARQANNGKASCCGSGSLLEGDALNPITANLYQAEQTNGLPAEAIRASFGRGNPTMLATIEAGETVLDLGSGGGIDVLALGTACRSNGQSLWVGYDRRDVGLGAGKPTKSRRD